MFFTSLVNWRKAVSSFTLLHICFEKHMQVCYFVRGCEDGRSVPRDVPRGLMIVTSALRIGFCLTLPPPHKIYGLVGVKKEKKKKANTGSKAVESQCGAAFSLKRWDGENGLRRHRQWPNHVLPAGCSGQCHQRVSGCHAGGGGRSQHLQDLCA
ncbi:hypothetical protein KOW79_000277 [Hemibagrus wyckioides]|uniref:Uncharacterized protein n=1 Tax=Hemibagrus wyckioides TaxID=337641 RepID=A0A9D3SXX2_9TELE|nr:hypothetical protein KOW79_000277 [Hemibagrus wyckioides]